LFQLIALDNATYDIEDICNAFIYTTQFC